MNECFESCFFLIVRLFQAVCIRNRSQYGELKVLFHIFGGADFTVHEGFHHSVAGSGEKAQDGSEGKGPRFSRFDRTLRKCGFVDDLDLIRYHDFGNFRFFQSLGQHDVDFLGHVGVSFHADVSLLVFRQLGDFCIVFLFQGSNGCIFALGYGNGCFTGEFIGQQFLLNGTEGRRKRVFFLQAGNG